jgi:hypothetical protein
MIGKKPVDRVDSSAVVEVLSPIWLTIPDTARRILQRIGAVLDFAHVKGWLSSEVSLRSVARGFPAKPTRPDTSRSCPMPMFRRSCTSWQRSGKR